MNYAIHNFYLRLFRHSLDEPNGLVSEFTTEKDFFQLITRLLEWLIIMTPMTNNI